jgi:hypothetical protein
MLAMLPAFGAFAAKAAPEVRTCAGAEQMR